MKKKRKETNDEIFSAFLIKEQELAYIEKKHGQAAVMEMGRLFREREAQATWITRICDFFHDQVESYQLTRLKNKSEKEIRKLKDEDKSNKDMEHLIYKNNDFNIHIFLKRKLVTRHLIADCGGVDIPAIEYNVFLRIEYAPAEIWTKEHYEETFYSYEQAYSYFEQLKRDNKGKPALTILNCLTEKIDNHCKILNQRIKQYNSI